MCANNHLNQLNPHLDLSSCPSIPQSLSHSADPTAGPNCGPSAERPRGRGFSSEAEDRLSRRGESASPAGGENMGPNVEADRSG